MTRRFEKDAQVAPQDAWTKAVQRADALRPLLRLDSISKRLAEETAKELGISWRRVYDLVKLLRDGGGVTSALLPLPGGTQPGSSRLSPAVDALISHQIKTLYLRTPPIPVASLHREICRECRKHKLPMPSRGSVQRRVDRIDERTSVLSRKGPGAARRLSPAGKAPEVPGPLRRIEMDHTPVDLLLVDSIERKEIGRPYLTLAIDKYSKSIVGAVVTFEAPSALSVALCLTQVVADKRPYLDSLGEAVEWPMAGKPMAMYVDNAAEFRSPSLTRGCEEHGISLEYRPPGRPHFGGTIERHIGTFMRMVHELPGTTQSSIADRGEYDSQRMAAMTLREFEQWLVLAIARYHGTFHKGISMTPSAKWAEGTNLYGLPGLVTNTAAFFLDFLPLTLRRITREGFVMDHVRYYSNSLKPWIADRDKMGRFELRRDPRDISHAWVRDPQSGLLVELQAREVLEPISLREHLEILKRHRVDGRLYVDVTELDRITKAMHAKRDESVKRTKKQKRISESPSPSSRRPIPPLELPDEDVASTTAEPFADLEQW